MHFPPAETASGAGEPGGPDVSAPGAKSSWLLRAKVLAPELPGGYVRRTSLLRRLEGLSERRLTVLHAPAGFGKTTALADAVRDRKNREVVVGWLSLDDDDTPNLFGSYLAFAFEQAGLDLGLLNAPDAWSSSPAVQQMGMLAQAVERHDAPCLLVLDEVERLPRRTVRFVDLLLKRAPRNLHVALAFRANPGLDLAKHVLDGGALVIRADELRFSTDDIARFFGGSLSPGELAATEERTAGWPVALRVYRNTAASEAGTLGADAGHIAGNFMGVRLLGDLSRKDRAHLLDLSVFDWIDASLVDEVLGSSDTRRRVVALSSLDGLLPPVDTDGTVRRLHPLLRDYCLDVLSVENPARKRALHRRIAGELARRGQLTPSWRHANAADDSRLVGQLLDRFGPFQLWQREGVSRLISAGRFLTPEIAARHPRLDLLRCSMLCLSSKRDEAAALFEAVSERTGGFARDRDNGDADALAVDRVFTRFALVGGADGLLPRELERNREKAIQPRTLKNLTEVRGMWVDIYSTALAVSAELTFAQYDSRAAIRLLTRAVDDVQETGIESLSNAVSALLAHYLAEVGRSEEAAQVWREQGLPRGPSALVDIEGQSWRTMEALSCSRIRLLAEQGEWAAAEELADRLRATASARGLVRTLLRALALSMVVAHRAGQPDRALARLVEFLRAARGVGYTRPLARHRDVSRVVLQRLLGTDLDEDLRSAAESMLAEVGDTPTAAAPFFSTRELEVLAEVGHGLRNEEIARRLGISGAGVRYHLKNIYRKTGASKRADAVRYARSLRVLPSTPTAGETT